MAEEPAGLFQIPPTSLPL